MPDDDKKNPFDFMGLEGFAKERTEQFRVVEKALRGLTVPWFACQFARAAGSLVHASACLRGAEGKEAGVREAMLVVAERFCHEAEALLAGKAD